MPKTSNAISIVAPVAAVETVVASAPVIHFDVSVDNDKLDSVKAIDFGKFAMREIVKGLRASEKGNRSNVIFHVGQVIETVARTMRRDRDENTDSIGTIKGDKIVPPGIERALNNTFREVVVAMIKAGDAPYLNCATTVARIKAMPRETAPQRKLWDYQARKLADSTLFLNGQAIEKPKGKYLPESLRSAKSKELVSSLKILRQYTNKIIAWLWSTQSDMFRDYAFRDEPGEAFTPMTAEDLSNVASRIEARAGGTMAELASAFAKPKAKSDERTAVHKMVDAFAKFSAEDRAEFLKLADQKHLSLLDSASDAEKAVNGDDDFDDLIEGDAALAA